MNEFTDMRENRGTWSVPTDQLPAVTEIMLDTLPPEDFDPAFRGQELATVYFDTVKLELRKNRRQHPKYITLRLRGYRNDNGDHAYAISAKTEQEKFRKPIDKQTAKGMLFNDPAPFLAQILPAHLLARLLDVSHEQPLHPAACVRCRRYAREDEDNRLTLDLDIATTTGKRLPYHILEHKSTKPADTPPPALNAIQINPTKLSKFLWATSH